MHVPGLSLRESFMQVIHNIFFKVNAVIFNLNANFSSLKELFFLPMFFSYRVILTNS